MPVTLTVGLDDKTGSGLDKLEQRLTNVGEAANDSAKEFETFARGLGKTDQEISDVEKSITKLARTSGQSEAQVRKLVMESMDSRRVDDFKKQIHGMTDAFEGIQPKATAVKDQLLAFGKAWLTFEVGKKLLSGFISLTNTLADRGVKGFVDFRNAVRDAREELLETFSNPAIARSIARYGEIIRDNASAINQMAESLRPTLEAERALRREQGGQAGLRNIRRSEADRAESDRIGGTRDTDQLRREQETVRAMVMSGRGRGTMTDEQLAEAEKRYAKLQAQIDALSRETQDVWEREGEAQKRFLDQQQATYLAYTKALIGMEKDREAQEKASHDRKAATFKKYLDVTADMEREDARQRKAARDKERDEEAKAIADAIQAEKDARDKALADSQKKRIDFLMGALGGKGAAPAAGGMGAGPMMGAAGGDGASAGGPRFLNFNAAGMQRFPFAGGGFFGMDPFRVFRGGSGVMPSSWGTGARGGMAGMGAGGGIEGLLGGLDPRKVRRAALDIAKDRAHDEDGRFDAGEFRRIRRSMRRGEAGDIEAEARGRVAKGEIQRAKQRGQLGEGAANDMMALVQKQTEGNAEAKQQTQQLNAIAQGIQTLVQQGQPRGGGQSRGTGNRRRGGRI